MGLQRAVRHGHASRIDLSISEDDAKIIFELKDDGCGFNSPSSEQDPDILFTQGKHGLAGMRQRVEAIGDKYSIESSPGHGTVIKVVVPAE